jgi:hypothetical protein
MGILNGGRDAPLTRRGRSLFYGTLLAILVVGFVLIIATTLSR